jgi:GMP synthase-like glutamine amidotransferase
MVNDLFKKLPVEEKGMKLHFLQHVPFEDLANIEVWAKERGHDTSGTLLFNYERLPQISDFDWLVILGGPMNVYEEKRYPWLVEEKKFVRKAIANKKIVLGICLGAQLIADVLGGRVYRNLYKEIGWYPVSLTKEAEKSSIFRVLPNRFIAFHWHGDTFDLPPGAIRTAESEGCVNQAFEYNERVIGLQFHLESSIESINRLIQNCGNEIVEGKYIQKPEEMLSQRNNLQEINKILIMLLNSIEREFCAGFG